LIVDRFASCGMARPDEVARLRHAVVAYVEELGAPEPVIDGVRLAVRGSDHKSAYDNAKR
jgi:hypothetical protein